MKKILKTTALLLILSLILPVIMVSGAVRSITKRDFRGLWVATVLNMDYPSKPATDPEILRSEAVKILEDAEDMGMNAIILQVRPASDALYKSKYFPWSKYLTGSQGLMPDEGFDPLEFWISEAHNRGMELHAWVNPYRITKEPVSGVSDLYFSHPAVNNPEYTVKYSDGNLYFNPGIPEVRKLIIDGVMEIIENYDADGIHFDDYFYPGKNFDDKAAYEKYGKEYKSIDDWRRANVDSLISDLSSSIRDTGKNVRFGISPFGIWANKSKNSLGSDTKGMQSYYDQYADTRKWVKDGLIDYITPQLYWNIGYSVADYSKLVSWWKNTVKDTAVDLYIGQAAYRAGNSDPSSPWYGVNEIARQLRLNSETPEVKGSMFFNYRALTKNPSLRAVIKAIYEQRDGVVAKIPVNMTRPSENIRTRFEKFYLNGSSDPGKPLYLNGRLIEERSNRGYFGILVPLEKGQNTFAFSQEGSYDTRVIFREAGSSEPKKMDTIDIPTSSVFPQTQEYRTEGEKITFSCQAPVGSEVTVDIGDRSYKMTPSVTAPAGLEAYPTTYTYEYIVPAFKGTPRNIDLGTPVYTMKYMGTEKKRSAPAKVGVIMKDSPFYAQIINRVVDSYESPSSANGADFELYNGMVDYVTGMTGSYVRLSFGQWVKKSNVKIYASKQQIRPVIKRAVYKAGEKWDSIKIDLSYPVAAIASFDGEAIKMNISRTSAAPIPVLPKNSLLSSVEVSKDGSSIQYTLSLKKNQSIEGYYVEKTSSGVTLYIKRIVNVKKGKTPLTGITIMLDPGHGGSEAGATGPLGLSYAEKTINLKTALKLQTELKKLGAKVVMTRVTDKTISLEERLAASRNEKPDMFISIHANSMNDNVDISKIFGFSVFYRGVHSKNLAEAVYSRTIESLDRNKHGTNRRNFYVTRGTWTPSILIESGFVPNPYEFEWLTDEKEQTRLAKTISEAVLKYFSSKR
ncbi:MAG: family 10 glycosylhydrolase [Clostridia bacterium]|nr:family 10 glycosylhydrolase [Clostridia bacterium]